MVESQSLHGIKDVFTVILSTLWSPNPALALEVSSSFGGMNFPIETIRCEIFRKYSRVPCVILEKNHEIHVSFERDIFWVCCVQIKINLKKLPHGFCLGWVSFGFLRMVLQNCSIYGRYTRLFVLIFTRNSTMAGFEISSL
jgi:hypothetical protein